MSEPIEWTSWTCPRHMAWFGAVWMTESVVDCIAKDCRVLVFIGPTTGDDVNVRVLLFSGDYRWIPEWPEAAGTDHGEGTQ